ncbi:MAG: hypothetical protein CBB60_005340 [Armatimonadetes bacterium Cent15-Ar3]|nr:MAG: hypothetical protein CBB60_005340 [Armatimonadetes bacterium Cent15-Ar3]
MSKVTKTTLGLFGAFFALIITSGCGGSGASSSPISATAFKQSVVGSLEQGFQAKAGTDGFNGGGTKAPISGDVYFDEYYELWAQPVEGGLDYFVDEALTQPAGSVRASFVSGEATGFKKTSATVITAGKYKGLTQNVEIVIGADSFDYTFSGDNPDTGKYSATGSYKNGTGTFAVKYKDENGVDRTYDVVSNADGTSRVEFNTGLNFVYTLSYAADGSGTGTVTGANALLPATITWNTNGDGQIVFADSSTMSFTDFNFTQI